ncbi:gamma-glutamyltransferase [Candidatus Persebacteraceae bacterium Df01]|jgi:gamma-glutamyltranspeptidase/glutathione hydrolase|uniref:Gamma-glutamyltransferase n=1 Tax=Candidatus Doriopsillibacter californiensis TaxID=2970740 RepID=A0ABT7QNC9_9GAMM|nr:gamma-glutamyltransferase [Candidatus Persebacteraceae bacterium Df01]
MSTAINIGGERPFFSPVHARNDACATSHPLATMEAINILQSGRSAADAAITVGAVQCVVEPYMTGINGDCFSLAKTPKPTSVALNGSNWTPHRLSLQQVRQAGSLLVVASDCRKNGIAGY